MNSAMFWLIAVVVVGFGIAGFSFIATAAATFTETEARTPATIGGVTCLVLATGILIAAVFAFRNRQ